MLAKDLTGFGLNEKESSAYVALLELGEATIGQVAKKAGVKRTTLYDIIESLKRSGFVGVSKRGKKTLYFAEDPRKLEEKLEEKTFVLKRMLPELLSIANTIDKKPKIRYYEGIDGIKEVYKDTLKYEDRELLAWVAEVAVEAFDEKFLNEFYISKRLEKKIWVRAIAPDLPYMQKFKGLDQASLRTTKLVDATMFPFEVEINLYGGSKIGIMSFQEKLGLIIESAKIHKTLKSIFELNWVTIPD
jgi:HTH-type transcriptional regulator, sugar sensing transcriptional regulator